MNVEDNATVLSHGVAAGEVRHDSAVIWARCVGGSSVPVTLQHGDREVQTDLEVSEESGWTGTVRIDRLDSATRYTYAVDCGERGRGEFRTAPAPTSSAPLRITWGGDIGGQNSCRDAVDGYSIFERIVEASPDLFLAVGDMVYVDNRCEPVGRYGNAQIPGPPRAPDLETFREHWSYNRADPHLQDLMARVPYVGIWDDHEIRNDSGARDDRGPDGDVSLFPIALRAFMEYLPLSPDLTDPTRIYRRLRWGRHAELFVLDTRQYRDRNDRLDLPDAPKTMLGELQREWLLESLAASDATWRIVA